MVFIYFSSKWHRQLLSLFSLHINTGIYIFLLLYFFLLYRKLIQFSAKYDRRKVLCLTAKKTFMRTVKKRVKTRDCTLRRWVSLANFTDTRNPRTVATCFGTLWIELSPTIFGTVWIELRGTFWNSVERIEPDLSWNRVDRIELDLSWNIVDRI